jgi:hypothetical protein
MRRVPFDVVVRVRVDVPLGHIVFNRTSELHVVDFWHVYPDKNRTELHEVATSNGTSRTVDGTSQTRSRSLLFTHAEIPASSQNGPAMKLVHGKNVADPSFRSSTSASISSSVLSWSIPSCTVTSTWWL